MCCGLWLGICCHLYKYVVSLCYKCCVTCNTLWPLCAQEHAVRCQTSTAIDAVILNMSTLITTRTQTRISTWCFSTSAGQGVELRCLMAKVWVAKRLVKTGTASRDAKTHSNDAKLGNKQMQPARLANLCTWREYMFVARMLCLLRSRGRRANYGRQATLHTTSYELRMTNYNERRATNDEHTSYKLRATTYELTTNV